ncbi:MAG: response regulator [Opitutaceae bacterium]
MSSERKPRLLLAEDNPAARELMESAATRSRAFSSVHVVEDGQAVLNYIWGLICAENKSDLPEVILTDLHMPGLNGVELTRDLKAHPETASIPVAVITSYGSRADRARASDAGCGAYFERPRRLDELIALLGAVGEMGKASV